jgi:carbamoyl-phosphate synthase large subunit
VYYTTTISGASAVCQALNAKSELSVSRLQDLHLEVQ